MSKFKKNSFSDALQTLGLDEKKLHHFRLELDKIGREFLKKVGEEDLEHIEKIKKLSDRANFFGKTCLYSSLIPLNPLWALGVCSLSLHFALEAMELGHNIIHGQFDKIPHNEEFNSKTWYYKLPLDEDLWKYSHNKLHHVFTNVVEKDPDIGGLFYRISKTVPWHPFHLFQFPMLIMGSPIAGYAFNFYLGFARDIKLSREGNKKNGLKKSLKKFLLFTWKEKLVPSLKGGPFFFNFFLGFQTTELITSTFIYNMFYCGHLPKGVQTFTQSAKNADEFCIQQILGSANFKCSQAMSILCGALDRQIEHHLFPTLPPNRLREISPLVKNLCEEYGIPYNEKPLAKQLGSAYWEFFKCSFPAE